MKLSSMILVLGTLPFLASCASWHTAGISLGLDHGDLTYQDAKKAIADGADVKSGWAGDKPFIQRAAELGRKDLVVLFLENGASPFEAPGGYKVKPFSLFEYVIENKQSENNRYSSREETDSINRDRELLKLCLKYRDASPEPMKTQLRAGLKKLKEELFDVDSSTNASDDGFAMFAIREICNSGILPAGEIAGFDANTIKAQATALLWTEIYQGQDSYAVDRLIDLGADVNAKDKDGHSILHVAITEDTGAYTVDALKVAGAKLTPQEATAALFVIIPEKDQRDDKSWFTIEELAKMGADVNAKDENGNPLILIAVRKGWSLEDIETLEKHGVKLPDKAQATALLWDGVKLTRRRVVFRQNPHLIGKLIALGADVNAKDENGNSVLYVAITERAEVSTLDALKAEGAKLTPTEEARLEELERKEKESKRLAMERAAEAKRLAAAEAQTDAYLKYLIFAEYDKVLELSRRGFDLTRTNKNGANAFHAIAATLYSIDESFIIKLNKIDGSLINKKANDGQTPLEVAIDQQNANAVRLFLKYGANPNAPRTVKGQFGSVEKSLMTFAIEEYNAQVTYVRSSFVDPSDRRAAEARTRRAKEIVSLMSQATGTEVTEL